MRHFTILFDFVCRLCEFFILLYYIAYFAKNQVKMYIILHYYISNDRIIWHLHYNIVEWLFSTNNFAFNCSKHILILYKILNII